MRWLSIFVLSVLMHGQGTPYPTSAPVTAYRLVNFSSSGATLMPHAGTGPATGVSTNTAASGGLTAVVSYGQAVCEFDTTPTLGNMVGSNGDLCHDTGQTNVGNVANNLGVIGRVISAASASCVLCYNVSLMSPNSYGVQVVNGVPSGAVVLSMTACSTGYTEVSALNGVTLVGTLAANGNVGTTGGLDNITPAGTVAQAIFTGQSGNTSSVSGGTPAGTNSIPALVMNSYTPAGVSAIPLFTGLPLSVHAHELPMQLVSATATRFLAAAIFGTGTSRASLSTVTTTANATAAAVALSQAVSAGTPTGTVSAPLFTGTPAILTGTVSAPLFTGASLAGHVHSLTPVGTVNVQGFTGVQFDNRSAFVRVIFCSKN